MAAGILDERGDIGPARGRRVKPNVLPMADPRTLASDDWFAAVRIEAVTREDSAPHDVDVEALHRARELTASALATEPGSDGVPSELAVRRHVLAAELKRLNGAQPECLVDYMAISRHFLPRREIAAALAYMRKALHVAAPSSPPPDRLAAKLLAAEVYLAAWQAERAGHFARQAARLADDLGDDTAREKAGALETAANAQRDRMELSRTCCPCGQPRPYSQCCEPADEEIPGEFLVRVHGSRSRPVGSPYWGRGSRGLDMLMTPPRNGGVEHPTYFSWRIENGRHRLLAYPNWTGRALSAARKMVDFSRLDSTGFEAPASAVLQSVCALEAFANDWTYFMRREVGSRPPPREKPVFRRGIRPPFLG